MIVSKAHVHLAIRSLAMAMTACGLWIGCAASPTADDDRAAEAGVSGDKTADQQEALIATCGNAGQTCCAGGTCSAGLRCNANNICRTPCGGAGERCCAGQACDDGLMCKPDGLCGPSTGGGGCTVQCGTDPISGQYCGSCGIGMVCSDGACVVTVGCTSNFECPTGAYCNLSSGLCCTTPLKCFQP